MPSRRNVSQQEPVWRHHLPLIIGTASIVILCAITLSFGLDGYYDERSERKVGKVTSFCELNRDGLLREPVNAISSLALCVPALVILHRWPSLSPDSEQQPSVGLGHPVASPFNHQSPELAAFVVGSILVGCGAFAAHGTKMSIASTYDHAGMLAWILIPALWVARRNLGFSRRFWFAMWVSCSMGFTTYLHLTKGVGVADAYRVIIVVWMTLEMIAWWRIDAPSRWMFAGTASFLAAYGAWNLGRKDSVACVPESVFQWHAAWHILCAVAIGFFWLHLRTSPMVRGVSWRALGASHAFAASTPSEE